MSSLTREQKIEIYHKRKTGISIQTLALEYKMTEHNIDYLIKLINTHGEDILWKDKKRVYSPTLKEEIINKVMLHTKPIMTIAIEYGLSSDGMLHNWIRSYKDNGYVIVEKRRGRKSTMSKQTLKKEYEDMTLEEKVKYLEDKNLYLEAEVEYRKKLQAVVQARKNQQPKKK